MRISVTDVGSTFGRQTRAYAEYRIFSTLARFGDVVHDADVSLTSTTPTQGPRALCVVVVTVDDGGALRSAPAPHVYDAINRAAQRIATHCSACDIAFRLHRGPLHPATTHQSERRTGKRKRQLSWGAAGLDLPRYASTPHPACSHGPHHLPRSLPFLSAVRSAARRIRP